MAAAAAQMGPINTSQSEAGLAEEENQAAASQAPPKQLEESVQLFVARYRLKPELLSEIRRLYHTGNFAVIIFVLLILIFIFILNILERDFKELAACGALYGLKGLGFRTAVDIIRETAESGLTRDEKREFLCHRIQR